MSSTDPISSVLGTGRAGHQHIPVNVYETTDALVLIAPMPGVRAENVRITVEPGQVTLQADLRTAAPKEYLVHEWEYGLYHRAVAVPTTFGGDVTATLGHGQLAVRLGRGAPTAVAQQMAAELGVVRVHPTEPMSGPQHVTPSPGTDATSASSGDTPMGEVIDALDADGFDAQFQAVEGGDVLCLTCHHRSPASAMRADDVTRLEGESDPSDQSIIVALRCPRCGARGTLVAGYGTSATEADTDVLLAFDRDAHADRGREARAPT